eukprot:5793791-Heterocapsa_arctica.AAC.1
MRHGCARAETRERPPLPESAAVRVLHGPGHTVLLTQTNHPASEAGGSHALQRVCRAIGCGDRPHGARRAE